MEWKSSLYWHILTVWVSGIIQSKKHAVFIKIFFLGGDRKVKISRRRWGERVEDRHVAKRQTHCHCSRTAAAVEECSGRGLIPQNNDNTWSSISRSSYNIKNMGVGAKKLSTLESAAQTIHKQLLWLGEKRQWNVVLHNNYTFHNFFSLYNDFNRTEGVAKDCFRQAENVYLIELTSSLDSLI